MAKILLIMIRFYQIGISPMMLHHCRFEPSCSKYAKHAIQQHGALRGSFLALRRLSRCHPWHKGGIDEVPTTKEQL